MKNRNSYFGILFLSLLFLTPLSKANSNCDAYYAVLDAQLEANNGGNYRTMDRIFDLRKRIKNPDKYYIKLLDYYLGAAGGEILDEFITSEGRKILPLLEEKYKKPIVCEKKYISICVKEEGQRNNRIDGMISAIKAGKVLKAAD